MNKKTAVEWLIQTYFGGIDNCTPDFRYHIDQAKELEKQQIIDAFRNGDSFEGRATSKDAEQYYRENFKNK
jgi:hypothetical protein